MQRDRVYTDAGVEQLANIVRQARGSMSFREFEACLGLSHGQIRRLESCKEPNPSNHTLVRIARYIGKDLEELQKMLIDGNGLAYSTTDRLTDAELRAAIQSLPRSELLELAHFIVDRLAQTSEPDN